MDPVRTLAVAISIISAIFNLFALWILISRSVRTISTLLWGSLLTLITLWCLAEMFIRSTDDFYYAISWFGLVLFAGSLVPPIILHFALEFPRRHDIIEKTVPRALLLILLYLPNIILFIKALITIPSVDSVEPALSIWGDLYTRDQLVMVVARDTYQPHYAYLTILIFSAMFVIYKKREDANNKVERSQLNLIFQGLTLVFIPGIVFDMLISFFFGIYTELFSLFVTFLASFTVYAIISYKFLTIKPELEEIKTRPTDALKLDPGFAYLFPSGAKDVGVKALRSELAQKRQGVVLTNKDVNTVKRELRLKRTPVIMVGEDDDNEFTIHPNNLDGLVTTMAAFMGATSSPILVIDAEPGSISKVLKGTRNGHGNGKHKASRNGHFLESWLGGAALMDLVRQSNKALGEGMSMVVFSYQEGDKVVRTQRPLLHMSLANYFLMKSIFKDILLLSRKAGDNPAGLLNELGTMDEFYTSCKMDDDDDLYCDPDYLLKLDRARTLSLFRDLLLVLDKGPDRWRSIAASHVKTVLERTGYSSDELTMHEGAVHFLGTEEPSDAFDICQELVAVGFPGLCISTRHPDKLKKMYGLHDMGFVWITSRSDIKDVKAIPISLEHIRREIKSDLAKNEESVIVLDGIELLVSTLGFGDVQRFLHRIKDEMASTRSRLLIPVHPKALDEQKLILLRREVEV